MTRKEMITLLERDGTRKGTRGFKESLFLLSAAYVGLSPSAIAKRSGLPMQTCRALVSKAENCGLFKNGKIHHSGWFNKKSGGVAFYLDCALLIGWLQRVP